MIFNIRFLLMLVYFLLITPYMMSQNTFEIKTNIPSVKMTYQDLEIILNDAHYLIQKHDSTFQDSSHYISVDYDDLTETIRDINDLNNLKKTNKLYYFFFNNGSVTELSMVLDDVYSNVSVKGNNLIEVQSIAKSIEAGFSKHRYFLGDRYVRHILYSIASIMVLILFLGLPKKETKNRVSFNSKKLTWKHYTIVAIYILFLIDPFNFNILTGFQLYNKDEVGFLGKHADLFTFFGFLIGFLAFFSTPIKRALTPKL